MAKKRRIKIRRRRTLLEKKDYLTRQAKVMSKKMTEPERIFLSLMEEMAIKIDSQKIVGAFKMKIYDFYIPEINTLIEIDGDYFHANPLIYEGKKLNKMQLRNQKNDKFKNTLAKGSGYKIERFWEYDLKNNLEDVRERILKLFM